MKSELPDSLLPLRRLSRSKGLLLSVLFLGPLAIGAFAQAAAPAPTAAKRAAGDDDTLMLDVFTVNADRDRGFVAATALAGGRMTSNLADTPVAYSVQTREFIEALNITTLEQAQEWAVSSANYVEEQSGGVALGGTQNTVATVRGIAANATQRNFFPGSYNWDFYNLERFDYTRGPNSILFGKGTISGTANAMTKFARLGRNRTTIAAQFDSYGSTRATADTNHPVTKNSAVRLNLMWDRGDTWRDDEVIKKKGFAPSFTINLTRNTELRVAGEYYEKEESTYTLGPRDRLSGWDGVTTYSALQPLTGSSVDPKFTALGVTRIAGAPTTANPFNNEYWMWGPDNNTLMNFAGTMTTVGYSGANNRAINGRHASSRGAMNIEASPFIDQVMRGLTDEELYGPATAGSTFRLPTRRSTFLPAVPLSKDRYRDIVAYLSHRVGDTLFFELAGDYNKRNNLGNASFYYNNGSLDGFGGVWIDLNKNLPDGTANPNFLEPYMRARMDRRLGENENRSARLAAAYVDTFRWAEVKLNAMVGIEDSEAFSTRENGVLPIDADPRYWGLLANNGRSRLLRFTHYYNKPSLGMPRMEVPLTAINPQTGAKTTYTPVWALATNNTANGGVINQRNTTTFNQAAAHVGFFKKRFIVLGAVRMDETENKQKVGLRAMDYPTGYVANSKAYIYRGKAPSDYDSLTYFPKDATGKITGPAAPAAARPLDANSGVPLAQYANDRFQNDYNPPSVTKNKTTKSIGAIVNLGRGFSLWGNFAQTFNPGGLGLFTIDYKTPAPSSSTGYDYGVRYNLPGGRVSANLQAYESEEKDFDAGNPAGYTNFNTFLNTNAIGDDSPSSRNIRNLGPLPDQWRDKSDRKSHGYEFELTANFTRGWRMNASVGTANAIQQGAFRETRAWVLANLPTLRLIALDAGIVLNNDTASLPTDPNAPRSIDAATGRDAFNGIMTAMNNWVTDSQVQLRLVKYTIKIYTDYRFSEGRLKGLLVGAGWRYRGPMVIGYRGADQLPNPTSPTTAAIDDPDVSAYTAIWERGYGLANVTLGYPWKFRKNQTIVFNLTIDNVFNYDNPIYISTVSRAYGNDFTQYARVQVPGGFTYERPRTYTLSARYEF
ncbi:TonB-dependent receptor plug domain-containing protein [Opitutus sp. ER46]|uniref:TonB-dependent receptor plug domain-containing protein n=1 Tax=Opitutus sp. ER46 TaxID=2161864 RepID=UPI000D2FD3B6|nr:TonB-dependent receptor plug domain-containing protein [Opitutus sp. ER46]PTY00372.1 hypothetical protein DB354_01820 [Opitutus sp. ER46]